MTGYIVIFLVSLTGFEEQVETLRDLSSVPASARNKVVSHILEGQAIKSTCV